MSTPKIEAQLKSCRFQFKKMVDNNRILCEAINLAMGHLETIPGNDDTEDVMNRIKELQSKLK